MAKNLSTFHLSEATDQSIFVGHSETEGGNPTGLMVKCKLLSSFHQYSTALKTKHILYITCIYA